MEALHEDCQDWLERCLDTDQRCDSGPISDDLDTGCRSHLSPDERKGTYDRLRSASKPHSTPLTLKWLEDNYELADGVCIPRSTLYVHYLDYCERNDTQPVNAASFGKIIRQQFPQLTTRRLGTRGQSKYHYYGIGVRESSRYYELGFSTKGVHSSPDGKRDSNKQAIVYSPRSKLGTLLPDFPNINDVRLSPGVTREKVLTFLMMYRTHCQRILDTVIRANFEEVQSFLLHFWQGMPPHIKSILESETLVLLVGVCDSILYQAIANVLMPTVLQPLPDSLTEVIQNFSVQLDGWLQQALHSLPDKLQRVKFDLSRRFSQVLKRQTSLNRLCQAARTVISSAEMTSQMLGDWYNVDLNSIVKQTLYTMEGTETSDSITIVKLARDFELLLEEQAPLESYIGWLDTMVEQCVNKKCRQKSESTPRVARQFLLMWSCVGTRVIRDMTLHSAASFGSFHLLHLMFDEYVLYTVENLHNQDRSNDLLRALKGEISADVLLKDILTPSPQLNQTTARDSMHSTQHLSAIKCVDQSHQETDGMLVFTTTVQPSSDAVLSSSSEMSRTITGPVSNNSFGLADGQMASSNFNAHSRQIPDSMCISNSVYEWPTGPSTGQSIQLDGDRQLAMSEHAHLHQASNSHLYTNFRSHGQNSFQWYDPYCGQQYISKRVAGNHKRFSRKCANEILEQNVSDVCFQQVSNLS